MLNLMVVMVMVEERVGGGSRGEVGTKTFWTHKSATLLQRRIRGTVNAHNLVTWKTHQQALQQHHNDRINFYEKEPNINDG